MSIAQRSCQALRKVLFGDTLVPQEFFIGLPNPQMEVAVWLHGMAAPIDVTLRHSMACAAPFAICIAFEADDAADVGNLNRLSLVFFDRRNSRRPLGEIAIKLTTMFSLGSVKFGLFEARGSLNRCLPSPRLWTHYLYHAYADRSGATSGMKMSFLERRAAMVMFIRPHAVSLVSLTGRGGGNIFPMNLMGDLGDGYVGFALRDSRRAAHLVEAAGRVAVSSVPQSEAPLAYKLAINHTKDFIDWEQLPFATMESTMFRIPVPVFAQRVRELEVEKVQRVGSHNFFFARVISDNVLSEAPGLCVIHGFYQCWRMRGKSGALSASIAEDALSKSGE